MTDQTKPMDAERLAEAHIMPCGCGERDMVNVNAFCLRHVDSDGIRHMTPNAGGCFVQLDAHSAEVERLSAEREEYERTRWAVVAQRNRALNELEAASFELARLRAVIEEARAAVAEGMAHYDRWIGAREMLKLLDRGLKGAGDE